VSRRWPSRPPADDDDEQLCVVCMEAERSHVFIPCGHVCLCEGCATSQTWAECPVCRVAAQGVMRIYAV